MAYFPLFIDIQGKKCLVAGGGKVACRKVRTLLSYGADVRLAALSMEEELTSMLEEDCRRIGLLGQEDLEGAILVVAATGDREENHRIAVLCHDCHIPVNVVDCPAECTFFFPAVVKRGDVSIGINTGGNSPGLSRHIRRLIEREIPSFYGDLARGIGQIRDRLKVRIHDEKKRRKLLRQILDNAVSQKRIPTPEEVDALAGEDEQGE